MLYQLANILRVRADVAGAFPVADHMLHVPVIPAFDCPGKIADAPVRYGRRKEAGEQVRIGNLGAWRQ